MKIGEPWTSRQRNVSSLVHNYIFTWKVSISNCTTQVWRNTHILLNKTTRELHNSVRTTLHTVSLSLQGILRTDSLLERPRIRRVMCKIKTSKWAGCDCPIRDTPIRCREDIRDPYTCTDVEWEEGGTLPGHCGCKAVTPETSEESSQGSSGTGSS
jgi:hypothetical protein